MIHALLLAVLVAAPAPPIRPDPKLTPGDTLPVTVRDICMPGYARRARHVPAAVKRLVYARYHITEHAPGAYEIDHLIPLELGGSNAITNLWPESRLTSPWDAAAKDTLETRLHRLVCAGQLDLATAQREIAADWIAAYQKYVHPGLPRTLRRRRR